MYDVCVDSDQESQPSTFPSIMTLCIVMSCQNPFLRV